MASVLGVIPARGGSKGVPRKNIREVAGKPLIAYTIEAAARSERLSRCVLSTEDEEIARVAREHGGDVPFRRPDALATDDARSLPVVQHALREMEAREDRRFDVAVLLQPTTPLRTTSDIDESIDLLTESGADSVVSVVQASDYHPFRMKRIVGDGRLINYIDQGFEDMRPRQELPPVYIRSGDLYVTRRDVVMEEETLVGEDCRAYEIPESRSVNIDTPLDLRLAEMMLAESGPAR